MKTRLSAMLNCALWVVLVAYAAGIPAQPAPAVK